MSISLNLPLSKRYIKLLSQVKRNGEIVAYCTSYTPFRPERAIQPDVTVGTHRPIIRLKGRLELLIRRNGKVIYRFKRKRDLLVWRGQSIFAYLLSQGNVGTSTNTWQVVASENNVMPDMGDDSGNPLTNEFSPLIGSPVNVTYDFQPTIKPSGGYQTHADLIIDGTVISDGNKTLRKVGVIDTVAVPSKHIILEDAVVPRNVILSDEIYIRYTIPLG